MKSTLYNRRDFLSAITLAGITISLPKKTAAAMLAMRKPVKVGIITDLHQDIMHDGLQRMQSFVRHMQRVRPNALLQMGDFAYPDVKNKSVIDLFNGAHATRLHVIGNHDTDSGFTKEQCLSYWGMPAPYYVQAVEGIHFIVLDGNEKGSPVHAGGYPSYIGPQQMAWLKQQLDLISGPVIIVSHQPLAGELAVDNATEVQELLALYAHKILIALNGHTHINAAVMEKGIHYVHINAASYFWVGSKYKHSSYAAEVLESHEWIAYTCPYKDPLFATLSVDPRTLMVRITGAASSWVGNSPEDLSYDGMPSLVRGKEIAPLISDRKFERPKA